MTIGMSNNPKNDFLKPLLSASFPSNRESGEKESDPRLPICCTEDDGRSVFILYESFHILN